MTHPREALEAHVIATLSEACREKLADRRHHGDWRDLLPGALFEWLRDEVRELHEAMSGHESPLDGRVRINLAAVRSECADVALLAGMILDCVERAPLRAGDTEAARWAARNRVLEARLQAVREAVK